jgi:hypothetical protein
MSAFWTFPPPTNAHCVDPKFVVFGSGVIKVFVDVMITTLPIPLILRLQLSRPQKRAVVVLLGLGYIVTAAGAIRTYYAYFILWRTYDESWYNYYGFLAATVENDLAIVCACAPALRPLMSRLVSGLSTVRSRQSTFPSQPKKRETQSGGTTSEGMQSESTRRPPSAKDFRGYTFWRTTVDNEDEGFSPPELQGQIGQAGLISQAHDVERDFQRDNLNLAETQVAAHQSEEPMSENEMRESSFRTWRIDNNPFQGVSNVYPNQQTYGGR